MSGYPQMSLFICVRVAIAIFKCLCYNPGGIMRRYRIRGEAQKPGAFARAKSTLREGLVVLSSVALLGCGSAPVKTMQAEQQRAAAPAGLVEVPIDPVADPEPTTEAPAPRKPKVKPTLIAVPQAMERIRTKGQMHIRASAKIIVETQDGVQDLASYEKEHGSLGMRYCWLVYQAIGSRGNVFLLNPKHKESNQPRYLGVVMGLVAVDRLNSRILGVDMVIPVRPTGRDPSKASGWEFARRQVERREDVLFMLPPGSMMPIIDKEFYRRQDDFCAFTDKPEYQFVAYGPSNPVIIFLKKNPDLKRLLENEHHGY